MSVIHIYRMLQVLELTTPTGASAMNYPVNRTDFTLARYVDNEIDFWVKNIDRKAVPLTNCTATIHLVDAESNRPLLSRDLTVVDATKGLVRLFITGDESGAFPLGYLRYSIVLTRPDNAQVMLYTDRERRGIGTVQVIEGPLPAPIEPIPLSTSDFLVRNNRLYSSALPGAAMVHNISGQHSAVLHLADFTGTFTVQGTLEVQPSSDDAIWFDITSKTFTNSTEVYHLPFEGNVMNVRFAVDKTGGSIDLVLYKN
jgi:hypothetical protein